MSVVDLGKRAGEDGKGGKGAPKPPPAARARGGRPSNASRAASAQVESSARIDRRTEAVAGLFNIAMMPAMLTGQLADVAAYNDHGPKIAAEAARIGEMHDRFGEVIDRLEVVGPYAGLVMAAAPLVLQLLLNHGRLPDTYASAFAGLGVVAPKLLEAKTLRMMAEQQAAAEAEAADIAAEYARLVADGNGAGAGTE